jgi:XRE family transcriptional regulator, regulator of sulfur utilization
MAAIQTTGLDSAVGARLRRLRAARGVSLSALARAAGIGKATLSGLEHGTRNPTLETLYAVAAALEVPLATLLLDTGAPTERAAVLGGAAVTGTLLAVYEEPTATFEVYRLHIQPGARQTTPGHPRGTEEHLTVFHGHLHAGPVEAVGAVGPGDHLSWVADVPHVYEVVGDEDVHASLLMRTPR